MTTTILASLILDPEKALAIIERAEDWGKPIPEANNETAGDILADLAGVSGLDPDRFTTYTALHTATIRRICLNQSAQEAEKNGGPVVQITGSGSKDDLIRLDREAMGK